MPTGQIKLGQNSLGFSDVRIRVDDTYLDERAELVVRGGIGLVGLTPATWGLIIEGQIAGKMLLALAPSEFSQASGVAEIEDNLTLSGRGARPEVFGTLRFSPVQPLAFVPRKWPRELAFRGGAVTLSDAGTAANRRYQVDIDDVTVAIDGEGSPLRSAGCLALPRGAQPPEACGLGFGSPKAVGRRGHHEPSTYGHLPRSRRSWSNRRRPPAMPGSARSRLPDQDKRPTMRRSSARSCSAASGVIWSGSIALRRPVISEAVVPIPSGTSGAGSGPTSATPARGSRDS